MFMTFYYLYYNTENIQFNEFYTSEKTIKWTPLHLAASNGFIEIIKLLSENKNINTNIVDEIYFNNYNQILKLLLMILYFSFWKKPIDYATNEEIKKILNHQLMIYF